MWLNFHHLRYFWMVAREGSVSRAAKKLRLTQPTVSAQLRELQDSLGDELLRRDGRNLVLTDVGEAVARIADDIFALGDQVLETVRGNATDRPVRLAVGISDAVPKHVAYGILEPALEARVQLSCREDTPDRLLADLTSHVLDVVISDAPSRDPRARDHLLGECGISIWGRKRLANELRVGYPRSLDGAPFLLPSTNTGLRRELETWFASHRIRPAIIGEFHDAALLARFAEAGAGLYAAPDAIGRPRGLVRAGPVKSLRARYYAITIERRTAHPAALLVARAKLFRDRVISKA